jgi:hypothetical protein
MSDLFAEIGKHMDAHRAYRYWVRRWPQRWLPGRLRVWLFARRGSRGA